MTKIKDAQDGHKTALVGTERVALTDDIANPSGPDVSTDITAIKNFVSSFITPGEINTGTNLGAGTQVYSGKSGSALQFKTFGVLNNKLGVSVVSDVITFQLNEANINLDNIPDTATHVKITVAQEVIIDNAVSTVSNSGAGASIIKSKTANTLTLRTFESSNSSVSISETTDTIDIIGARVLNAGTGQSLIHGVAGKDYSLKGLISTNASIDISTDVNGNIDIKAVGTGGEINTASNIGTFGQSVYKQKVGADLQFKQIREGVGITVTSDSQYVIISSSTTPGEINTASNVGTGVGVFKQKSGNDLEFKSLTCTNGTVLVTTSAASLIDLQVIHSNLGSADIYSHSSGGANFFRGIRCSDSSIIVDQEANDINIRTLAEINTASNVGTGVGVFKAKTGPDMAFKTLLAGAGMSLFNGTNEITITSTSLQSAFNLGTGAEVFKEISGTGILFRRIKSTDSSISITENANDIDITVNGSLGEVNTISNIGVGASIYKQKVGVNFELKRLATNSEITIISNTNDIEFALSRDFANTGTGANIFSQDATEYKIKRLRSTSGGLTITENASDISFSISGAGETNTASNLGGSEPVYYSIYKQKIGVNFEFKQLRKSDSITLTSDGSSVIIGCTALESWVPNGGGADLLKFISGTSLFTRTFTSSTYITATQFTDTIRFDYTGPLGDVTAGDNVGAGTGIFKDKTGSQLNFKSIRSPQGTIEIFGNTNEIEINSNQRNASKVSYPDNNDDSGDNYDYGSNLIETTNSNVWTCLNSNSGAASWGIIASYSNNSTTSTLDCRDGLNRIRTTSGTTTLNITNWKNGYRGTVDFNITASANITIQLDGSTTNVKPIFGANNPMIITGSTVIILEFFISNNKLFYRTAYNY